MGPPFVFDHSAVIRPTLNPISAENRALELHSLRLCQTIQISKQRFGHGMIRGHFGPGQSDRKQNYAHNSPKRV